jgi:antitoxin PrlF
MLLSTVTSKGQATVPAEIRRVLHLQPGDKIKFEVQDHQVLITKADQFDYLYHTAVSSTLNEWDSPEDDEAYRDL